MTWHRLHYTNYKFENGSQMNHITNIILCGPEEIQSLTCPRQYHPSRLTLLCTYRFWAFAALSFLPHFKFSDVPRIIQQQHSPFSKLFSSQFLCQETHPANATYEFLLGTASSISISIAIISEIVQDSAQWMQVRHCQRWKRSKKNIESS